VAGCRRRGAIHRCQRSCLLISQPQLGCGSSPVAGQAMSRSMSSRTAGAIEPSGWSACMASSRARAHCLSRRRHRRATARRRRAYVSNWTPSPANSCRAKHRRN